MRAVRRVGVVLGLALVACRSRSAGTADAGVPPLQSALTCEALVPLEVREALPGFTLQEERPCPTCGPLCTFRSAQREDVTVSIAYDCRPRDEETDMRALLAPTLRAGGVEVPALGRVAARGEPVPGMLQVVTWDDDTPCGLVITWLGPDRDRALDLAQMVLFATNGERLARAAVPAPEQDAGR